MATIDTFYKFIPNHNAVLDQLLTMGGPQLTGGPHRCSLLQLPLVSRTTQISWAMMNGVTVGPEEDPAEKLLAHLNGADVVKEMPEVAEVTPTPSTKEEATVILKDAQLEADLAELARLRAEEAARAVRTQNMLAGRAKQRASHKIGR